jgi:UDP-N-acetylmuramoyl-tripeptide--D-alanyl-D-alanine ligase
MKTVTLGALCRIIRGKWVRGVPERPVTSVNFGKIRHLKSHQVYFYTRQADWSKQLGIIRKVGPLAVVLPEHFPSHGIPAQTGLIRVHDAYAAFWKVAKWSWKKSPARVIGITGSSGKSTTTAMAASILKYRWPMVKTEGNLNTFSFLPTYLTRLKPHHKLLLLEMGMKSLNNIARQCRIVRPNVGVVTNVGEAHAGSLGGLNQVVRAKQEIVNGIRPGGILFLNADDARSRRLNTSRFNGKIRTFGIKNRADLIADNIHFTSRGMRFNVRIGSTSFPVIIPVFGVHNVYNALAAIGIARTFGAKVEEIQKGLATFQPPKMRLQFIQTKSGRLLINDAWNANPASMTAGLDVLKHLPSNRPKIAVLGDMLELGSYTRTAHESIGKHVVGTGLDQLVTIGKNGRLIALAAVARGMNPRKVSSFYSYHALVRHLLTTPKNAILYFKASRSLHLEKVVQNLK